MSKTSPTQRSIAKLKGEGFIYQIVEKWVPFPPPGHRVDLFGIIDIVAMKEGVTGLLGIQACADGSHSTRIIKAFAEPRLTLWKACGNRFQVWSWGKKGARGERKLWQVRISEL